MSLPGARGFGWFFRYLTFCSYTLQLLQLGLCVMVRLSRHPKQKYVLGTAANHLSSALFGLANTVTAMFYAVENATHGLVEGGGEERPWWLDFAVHVLNSGVAWVDLFIVEERSFSGRSRHLALFFALAYSAWLLLVRHRFGKFPYPILNSLPFPWGFLGFILAGVLVMVGTFEVGRTVKHSLLPAASRRARKQKPSQRRAE